MSKISHGHELFVKLSLLYWESEHLWKAVFKTITTVVHFQKQLGIKVAFFLSMTFHACCDVLS